MCKEYGVLEVSTHLRLSQVLTQGLAKECLLVELAYSKGVIKCKNPYDFFFKFLWYVNTLQVS